MYNKTENKTVFLLSDQNTARWIGSVRSGERMVTGSRRAVTYQSRQNGTVCSSFSSETYEV